MDAKVSVIIVNFNGKADTLECLDSVYKINYPNFEIIVVDNGSSDGSREAIKTKFPNLILIENKTNKGFCIANNLGVKRARERGAEYVLALNNDVIVKPTIIGELKKALGSDKKICAVSPHIAYYDQPETLQFRSIKIDWANGGLLGQDKNEKEIPEPRLIQTDIITWCVVLFRAELIDSVGYLDEQFFAYYEDVDWSVRCGKAGLGIAVYPKTLAYHKGSRSSGGIYSPLVYYYLFRNKLIFMRKQANLARKVQFSVNYIRDTFKNYSRLLEEKNLEAAEAVTDAFWSAVSGCRYDTRIAMPQRWKENQGFMNKVYLWSLLIRQIFSR